MLSASAELALDGTEPPLLAVTGLSRAHGPVRAVSEVSLSVRRGEVIGLLGANGAGKTSLLGCVAGLQRAQAGHILIDGIDVFARPALARSRTGVLLQHAGLPARLTVAEVLRLFVALRGVAEDASALAAAVGLAAKLDARVEALSGGQRQRLALAIALIGRPPLLLLDEPGSGLDPAMRTDLQSLLRSLRAQGHGILLATHDMAEAEALCDRVVILAGGRVLAEGTPAALVAPLRDAAVVRLRTSRPVDPAVLEGLGAVLLERDREDGLRLRLAGPPEAFVAALGTHLSATGNRLLAISLGEAGLQDVIAGVG